MRISNALLGIILTFTPWNVRASKNSMSGTDAIAAAAAAAAVRESAQRELLGMSSNKNNNNNYEYKRTYITIIEPDNFVSIDPDQMVKQLVDVVIRATLAQTIPTSIGTSTIQNGRIYDPADIEIVNKPNGIEPGDLFEEFGEITLGDVRSFPAQLIGQRYAGDRQPKTPIPVGDSAYFFHGECVATSALPFVGKFPDTVEPGEGIEDIKDFSILEGAFVITSHTCLLNLCLGGGGFDCIAIYAGTSFVFDFGQQLNLFQKERGNFKDLVRTTPTLPPPYPATIIGGTGDFGGIEGTVQIATIAGSAGAFLNVPVTARQGDLGGLQRFGFIVQSISVTSNMPLPTAP